MRSGGLNQELVIAVLDRLPEIAIGFKGFQKPFAARNVIFNGLLFTARLFPARSLQDVPAVDPF